MHDGHAIEDKERLRKEDRTRKGTYACLAHMNLVL